MFPARASENAARPADSADGIMRTRERNPPLSRRMTFPQLSTGRPLPQRFQRFGGVYPGGRIPISSGCATRQRQLLQGVFDRALACGQFSVSNTLGSTRAVLLGRNRGHASSSHERRSPRGASARPGRVSRKAARMKAESEAQSVQSLAYLHFRAGVLRPDARHHPAAAFF